MNYCALIADSGSTKTDWILKSTEYGILEIHTTGINPVRDSQDAVLRILQDELLPQLPAHIHIHAVYFYGAGCIHPYQQTVEKSLLQSRLPLSPDCQISVESDLLGAARALCGHQPGIACILGTGANSCLYDGQNITQNTPALGFILGDEGSGAVLGKTLLNRLLKGTFPPSLTHEFLKEYRLTLPDIITRVYREPQPNKFLASLVPFIGKHRQHPQMHQMLIEAFRDFFVRNIRPYGHAEMPVHFVGGIAQSFQEELREAAAQEGFTLGRIIQKPIIGIANFHEKGRETR